MAGPLKIKAAQTAPLTHQVFVAVVFGIPVFYLAYLWRTRKELHFSDPRLNLAAHALMLILPVVWAVKLTAREIQFVESPGEFLAFTGFRRSWWKSVLLYQSALLGVVFVAHATWRILRGSVAPPSTSVVEALVTMMLVFLFTFAVREGRKTKIWMLDDGLRIGLARFVPWQDIDHAGWHGRVVEIFHRENRHIPTASAVLREDASLNMLRQRLEQRGVRQSTKASGQFVVTRLAVIVLAAVIFSLGLAAHDHYKLDAVWAVLLAMSVGVFAMWLLEKTYIPASTRIGRPIILKQ